MEPFLALLLLVGLIALVVLVIQTNNRLAPLKARIDEARSNIKRYADRRDPLINQLLEIAAGYATHEKDVHSRISADFNATPKMSRHTFAYVSHLTNTFPELRAERSYTTAMQELSSVEASLQRKFEEHSAAVREYNSVHATFPHNFLSLFCGYSEAEHLDSSDFEPEPPPPPPPKPKVWPYVGMKYRDKGRLHEIIFMDDKNIHSLLIPRTGRPIDCNQDIDYWQERIADGQYTLEVT
jgi:LemA protein